MSATATLLVAVVVVAAAGGEAAVLDDALRARDEFDHERAIAILTRAIDEAPDDAQVASLLWHKGALLAESRKLAQARDVFARAAATRVPPELRIMVAPSIQQTIDEALARARPEDGDAPSIDEAAPPDDGTPPPDEHAGVADAAEPATAPPAAVGSEDEPRGVGALTWVGAGVAALGGVVLGGGGVVWGLGLAEHVAASAATEQVEAAERNAASAPLQIAGQVGAGVGAALVGVGVIVWLLDRE